MNKFSKVFAVLFLVSSVSVFAMETKESDTAETTATVPAATTPAVKASYYDKAAAALATAGTKVKAVLWNGNVFHPADLAPKATIWTKLGYKSKVGFNYAVRPVVAVGAALVAYKLYKNKTAAEQADLFEDEDEDQDVA